MCRIIKTGVVIVITGLLAACGSSTMPPSTFKVLGNNSYSMTTVSSSAQQANSQALQTAQRLCANQGLQSQTQSGQSHFADHVHSFTLEFNCI